MYQYLYLGQTGEKGGGYPIPTDTDPSILENHA